MGWSFYIYTKENVCIDDLQNIINMFPDDWFYMKNVNRCEKPVKQNWGWSTIVDISNPRHNWNDEEYGLGIVGVLIVSGCFAISSDIGKIVVDFIKNKLIEMNYTIIEVKFNE